MRRHVATVTVLAMVGLAACGGPPERRSTRATATDTNPASRASPDEQALGLTRRLPAAYRRVCTLQALAAPHGAQVCPPLIPAGPLRVLYRGKSLGRDSTGGGFSADLASPALRGLKARPIDAQGGHWRYDVVWKSPVRRVVVGVGVERPSAASQRSACRRTRVGGRSMIACRVAAHDRGGGLNGGHVAYVWERAGLACVVSLHGYANQPRARAMIAALAAAVEHP